MAGGSGTRLWPYSRNDYPKPFLPLFGDKSLFVQTVERLTKEDLFHKVTIIAHKKHHDLIMSQFFHMDKKPYRVLLEPLGRDTSAAICCAALSVANDDPEALILITPSDQWIKDVSIFQKAVTTIADLALKHQKIINLGILPDSPRTVFGHMVFGQEIEEKTDVFKINHFVEKPPLERAKELFEQKQSYWNTGVFVCPAKLILSEIKRFNPDLYAQCEEALQVSYQQGSNVFLKESSFEVMEKIAIDYAVMEKTDHLFTHRLKSDWNDLGTWDSYSNVLREEDSKESVGDVCIVNASNSFGFSRGPKVTVIGLDDVIVAAANDGVLVMKRGCDSDLKKFVEGQMKTDPKVVNDSNQQERPWGRYDVLKEGQGFKVKELVVYPGQRISLQKHDFRHEMWSVAQGKALVTKDDKEFTLEKGDSIDIPLGCKHRVKNIGSSNLVIIEMQQGERVLEEDIVRFDDDYGRLTQQSSEKLSKNFSKK